MNTTTCPERNRLRDYLHGRLDEIDSDAVEEHLASCGECEEISSRLDQDGDWLTHYLRASADQKLARESVPGWIPEVRQSLILAGFPPEDVHFVGFRCGRDAIMADLDLPIRNDESLYVEIVKS